MQAHEQEHSSVDASEARPVRALVAVLLVVVLASSCLVVVNDASSRAVMAEREGQFRGQILDDRGKPLAYTVDRSGNARRVYVLPSLSLPVGFEDPKGQWHGLESRFDAFLSARHARHDWRTFFLHLRGEAARGGSVRLTLDSRLQSVADRALGNAQGAIVAIDPGTGAVRALVDKPDCTPAQLSTGASYRRCLADPRHPLLDRALQQLLVPGSSFKIVTLTAALDSGRFTLGSIFSGADAFGPSPYFDNVEYPSNVTRSDLTQLTLAQALAFSDNFAFAHIGLTLGADTLLRYAHRYYIGRRIPFVYPVAQSVIAAGNPRPSTPQLAQSSFGAEVDRVTPLQMALIAATVANRGTMMAPRLIDALVSSSGTIVQKFPPHILSHVMAPQSATQVAAGMKFVVDHGSGFNAQIARIAVAGKTGTAASGGSKPHAWFIAFAPIQHPVIAVAVLNEFTGEGFQYAAPLARRVLVAALQERGYRVK